MSNYKFGFCDWMLPVSGPGSLLRAAELGYDGVQFLDTDSGEGPYPLEQPEVRRALQEAMAETGVAIHLLMLHGIAGQGKVKCRPDTTAGREGLTGLRQGVEACQAIGIPRIMLYSWLGSQIINREELANTAAFLRAAAEIICDGGLELVYESFKPLADTIELYERSGQAFKLCYDTLNPVMCGFGDAVEELPQYLASGLIDCVHLKDIPETGPAFAPLGKGSGSYRENVEILHKYNYTGWLVCENDYKATATDADGLLKMLRDDLGTMRHDFC